MRRCNARTILVLLFAVLPLLPGARAGAQDIPVADGPRFLFSSSADAQPVEVDASRIAALSRKVSLAFDNVRLEDALDELSRQVGVRFVYVGSVLPLDKRVQFRSENITVAAALTELLFGLRVDVVASGASQLALVRREQEPAAPVGAGAIVGRVTEAGSGSPIVNAQIAVDGRGRTITDEDGRYRIDGVAAGRRTVSVTSIGYARASQDVEVGDDATVTVDFALEVSPSTLDELVVTATGQQRRVELGHVVGRINADSVVKEAPVSTLSELLTGRIPGVQVYQMQGTVGGEVKIQIRGANSVRLNNEPIVIVDGVRYASQDASTRTTYNGPWQAEHTSPLNDINPNDIESIEVVKGPSAATLYGTDAANGVIVVTTKRGRAGQARWNLHAGGTTTAAPEFDEPGKYWGWRSVDGVPSMTRDCDLFLLLRGTCSQDSISVIPNPLNDPDLSVLQRGWGRTLGADVSGGQERLSYYLSGAWEEATGMVRMPPAMIEQLEAQRGARLPKEQREPNAQSKLNLRAAVTADISSAFQVRVNAGYTHSSTRSVQLGNPYTTGGPTPLGPYLVSTQGTDPAHAFAQTSTEEANRFFTSATGHWRPLGWLLTHATLGLDLGTRHRYSLVRREDDSLSFNPAAVGDDRLRQTATNVDLGATATARRGRVSSRTSIGVQYERNLSDALFGQGRGLPPGGTSVGDAANRLANQSYSETVKLGTFLEERVGLNERLFLTGALRIDGASTFGRNYDAAIYPKVSASWLVSEEPFVPLLPGLDEFRLRYAFGASGLQPPPDWARLGFETNSVVRNGAITTVVGVSGLGNPELRPERVQEHEIGFDAGILNGRVRVGLTWYDRQTRDQIFSVPLPPGMGSVQTNLGLTTQHGFELDLYLQPLDTRPVSWDIRVQHGVHRTKLVDLGDASEFRSGTRSGYAEGYPLGALFGRPVVGYDDANGDGILSDSEVELGEEWLYVGEGRPPISQTITSTLGFFDRRVRASALFERRAGFMQVNRRHPVLRRAFVDPTTPLDDQARRIAGVENFAEPGDFIRLREVTLAIEIPAGLAGVLRSQSGSIVLSGRNLALWSDYSGRDPEGVFDFSGAMTSFIPQGRTWSLRLNLDY